ncbi:6,7,8-trihydroxycoumarin synthase isoform X2 [Solanum lycopersicum]|uniref:Cytochrome P450 n=1 Tax=Solanum lycopersicum TaxID=4081 RepID=A0A3Q7ETH4_SOLLC|nr:cytochrome P450 71A1 [Solanum lycopersicum]
MEMLLLFLVAIPIIVIFLVKLRYTHNHPPSPPGLPLLGNLYQLNQESPHKYLWELSKKYGPLMFMKLGFSQLVVISSSRIAKEVLKTHDFAFSGRPSFLGQRKLSYNGLDVAFSPYNNYWREMKKICTLHLFSPKKVQSFRPIREDEVSRMINRVTQLASSSKLVNLSEIMSSLSSNISCIVGFGKRYDEKGYESKRFSKLLCEAQAMIGGFFLSDYFPIFGRWIDCIFTRKANRLEKIYNELDLFYQELIEEHLSPTRPKSMDGDIIDMLIALRDQNQSSSSLNLTWDHIKAVLMDIFIAGTDTNAAALVWAMTALMKEGGSARRKLQQGIRELVGKKGRVYEDDIQNLPYLRAVIKETLKLYPPAPLIPRETMEKCIIDGYEIKQNTPVSINAWAIGRDPECWENPDEFIPERFCDVNNNGIVDYKSGEFEMIPFGGGRRGCPGISLGVATVELALANLLYAFDWELPYGMVKEDIDIDTLPGMTMHKKNPLCLVAKKYLLQ